MPKIDEKTAATWVVAHAPSARETVRTTVDIPAELRRDLRTFGVEDGLKSAVIRGLLVQMLTDGKLAARAVKRAAG